MELLEGKTLQVEKIKEIASKVMKLEIKPTVVFIIFEDNQLISKKGFELHCEIAKKCGFSVITETLPKNVNEHQMLDIIDMHNNNKCVNAIMIFIPVPEYIDFRKCLNRIDHRKEVEGLHPENAKFIFPVSEEVARYNTVVPTALTRLFNFYSLDLENVTVTVVLDDDIILNNEIADFIGRYGTVSLLPSKGSLQIVKVQSKNVKELCQKSDVVIFSTLKPKLIDSSWVKNDAILVDFVPIQVGVKGDIPIIEGSISIEDFNDTDVKIFPALNGIGPVMISVLMENIYLTV